MSRPFASIFFLSLSLPYVCVYTRLCRGEEEEENFSVNWERKKKRSLAPNRENQAGSRARTIIRFEVNF